MGAVGTEPDGTLVDWRDIAGAYEWDTLLLGNGMSINIWEPFRYRNLYGYAKDDGLSVKDQKLFAATPNFERVLGDLLTAIRVNKALGLRTSPLVEGYRNIQLALVKAVRAVHLNRERVPVATRETIAAVMKEFEWVFTTSYDLLAYWAMGCRGGFNTFMDHFRWGGRCEFDPKRARPIGSRIPVYFLHGALHLVTGEGGATWKLTQGSGNLDSLLSQFGRPIEGDASARPLVVTEGSANDKLNAIERNLYLSHALERLSERDLPVVVFGSSFSEQDSHLADALSQHPDRPIAVSMLPGPKKELLLLQNEIFGRLESELLFFDATTHPLGTAKLSVPVAGDER